MKLAALAKKVRPHVAPISKPHVDGGETEKAWHELNQNLLSWRPAEWSLEVPENWSRLGSTSLMYARYEPSWANYPKLEITLMLVSPSAHGGKEWGVHMEWLLPSFRTGQRGKNPETTVHGAAQLKAEDMVAAFGHVSDLSNRLKSAGFLMLA